MGRRAWGGLPFVAQALMFIAVTFLITEPAFAWEFKMKVKHTYRGRFLQRMGNIDLFGNVNAPGVGFSGPSYWGQGKLKPFIGTSANDRKSPGTNSSRYNYGLNPGTGSISPSIITGFVEAVPNVFNDNPVGLRITGNGFSRGFASFFVQEQNFVMLPEFTLNDNVKVNASITMGGTRNKFAQGTDPDSTASPSEAGFGSPPFEDFATVGSRSSGEDTISAPSWRNMEGAIDTPWGSLVLAGKGFLFGTGCTFGSEMAGDNYVLSVPYGPMNYIYSLWLNSGSSGDQGADQSSNQSGTTAPLHGLFVNYASGPMDCGVGAVYRETRTDPAMNTPNKSTTVTAGQTGNAKLTQKNQQNNVKPLIGNMDERTLAWVAYAKYFNGRFFFNSEYAWMNVDMHPSGQPQLVNGGPNPNGGLTERHYEANHFFLETGIVTGPARFSFLFARSSGPVLNNNNVMMRLYTTEGDPWLMGGNDQDNLTNPAYRARNPKVYASWPINHNAMSPYEYLMFNQYAGGNMGGWRQLDLGFVDSKSGMMTDGYCFGGRVDYAIAANLNVFGSYLWAHRLERAGTLFGQYRTDGGDAAATSATLDPSPAQIANVATVDPLDRSRQRFATNAGRNLADTTVQGFVSDGFIGWEINAGITWQLLENLTFSLRYSYWQPGKWFNEAYQGVGFVNGGVSEAVPVGTRSPIQALQWSFESQL